MGAWTCFHRLQPCRLQRADELCAKHRTGGKI